MSETSHETTKELGRDERIMSIVVAYGHGSNIIPTLVALSAMTELELVVWDNSTDPTHLADILRSADLSNIILLGDGTNYGFGGAINRAYAAHGRGRDVLLVNPDCIVELNAVQSLRKILSEDQTIGIAAPMMQYPNGRFGIAGGHFPTTAKEVLAATRIDDLLPGKAREIAIRTFDRVTSPPGNGSGLADSMQPGGPVPIDWVSGFCMLVSGAAISQAGFFDEKYFLYFEDVDLCRRFASHGYTTVLDRSSRAEHDESSSTSKNGKGRHYYTGLQTYMREYGNPVDRGIASALRRIAS